MTVTDAPSVLVRPAGTADFDAWLALFEAVAAEGMWMGSEAPLDPVARREFFDRCLSSDEAVVYLAEVGGRLVGAINLTMARGLADLGMFVARDHRGAGVGSAMVEAAVGWAREAGAHKLVLGVWPHNHAARGLYSKYGFVTEGTRRRQYRRRNGQLWDVVSMGLVLDESTPGGPHAERRPPPAPVDLPAGGIIAGHLVLRPWRTADIPDLPAAVDDPEIHRWLDIIPNPYTPSDATEFVSRARRDLAEGRGVGLAVTSDGGLVGAVGVRLPAYQPGVGEVGYWVSAGARGRGVATAATRALTAWAFDELGLHRVELYAATENAASRAVAERAGFELEGIRRAWRKIHDEPCDFAAYARLAPTRDPRRS